MSHSVDIETSFNKINILLEQFKSLGWHIEENARRTTYPTDPRRNQANRYVAKNPKPGGYDVGIDVVNGNAVFVCDFYDRSIEAQLGEQLLKVKQGYSTSQIKKFAHMEDLDYRIDVLPNGELRIIAEN